MTRVLGCDPGLAITGYGILDSDGQQLTPIAFGVLRTKAGLDEPTRLLDLYQKLVEMIQRYQPDVAAVEKLFFSTNVRTAMMVSQARGVLLLSLAEAGLPIWEYTPMQIKQAVTGYGQADKLQIQEMVRLLLNLREIPRPDDAADALAVSICHLHSTHLNRLIAQ